MKAVINKIKSIQDDWYTALHFIDRNQVSQDWSKNTEW